MTNLAEINRLPAKTEREWAELNSRREELYYRALLLPRIPVSGRWAPAVDAALHAIAHFYTPWNYLVFFLAFLPLAYYVRLRGNVLPTIITHILFNSAGVILALAGLRLPFNRVRSFDD